MHERITVRMTDDMIARLDAWIATQPGYVSRQDVVRRCIELVLERPQWLSAASRDAAMAADHGEARQNAGG